MKKGGWLREVARDLVALGGLPFFALVLVRVWMLDNVIYFSQFVVAGVVFGLVFLILRQNVYSGLGLIIFVFTSFYYEDFLYSVFGGVAYLLLIGSLVYLGRDWRKVVLGVLVGGFSIWASFIYPNLW